MSSFLTTLDALINQRKQANPSESYTSDLINSGADRILRKVGEEAGEFIIAGKNKNATEICNEGADLLFHLMVFLQSEGLSIHDVIQVLEDRHQQS